MAYRQRIGIFTSTEGHWSISQAIKGALEKKYNVELFYERDSLFDLYLPMYQLLPQAQKIPFTISQNEQARKALSTIFRSRYQKKVEDFFAKHRPDLVLSTYFMYNPNLESAANISGIPYINILTDPRTIHPLLISNGATTNLAFDAPAKKALQTQFPNAKVDVSGWFVRDQFEAKYDLEQVRSDLKLSPKVLTLLIASGSEGTSMIMKILPALISTPTKVQVIVACGANKSLARGVRGFKMLFKKMGSKNSIKVLGFTDQIHKYMQAADLIIGKAGPNMLFESVATRTPFFAITHISGQEDGNLDIIKEYNLGYVEENLFKAQGLIRNIIANPNELAQFLPHLDEMALHNQHSKQLLMERIGKLIG